MSHPTQPGSVPSARGRKLLLADRYEVLGLVGVGGMGRVYRVLDTELDEVVALKVIAQEFAFTPSMLERFRREVKLARRVTHKNVARMFDIGEHQGERFLTMELVEGESLGARFTRRGPIPETILVPLLLQICEGLAAAHEASIVHRDLKPDNVLLANDGRVVLTDFGIASARRLEGEIGQTLGIVVGTPDYMAPEQVEASNDIDGRTDLYALGAMTFELVTGTAPWSGPSAVATLAARLIAEAPDPRAFGRVSDELAAIILRCMKRRPDDRFATARDVADALAHVAARAQVSGTRSTVPAPAGEKRVVVLASVTDDDELARAAADGFLDLVERNLRGAASLQVVSLAASAQFSVRAVLTLEGEGIVVAIELVDEGEGEGTVIARPRECGPRSDLFAMAARVASAVGEALAAGPRPTLPSGPGDGDTVALWLRARFARGGGGRGARDRAVALFERAITRAPDDAWINAGYAATLVDRFRSDETEPSDLVEARAMAERALASSEALGEAWLARALCLLEFGEPGAAVDDLVRAAKATPNFAPVHAARGSLLLEVGQIGRAIAHLDRAIALEPQCSDYRVARAMALALDGDVAGSNGFINEAIVLESRSPAVWLAAARLAVWANDEERAEELLRASSRVLFERRDRVQALLEVAARKEAQGGPGMFAELAEVLSHMARRPLVVREARCRARGAPRCEFVATAQARQSSLEKAVAAPSTSVDAVVRHLAEEGRRAGS